MKRLFAVLALAFLVGCNGGKLVPRQPCFVSCYTGPSHTQDVGICKAGTWSCSGSTPQVCMGEVTPQTETCNDLDDDCNGTVDDNTPDSRHWYRDHDGDGYGSDLFTGVDSCQRPEGFTALNNDCDDTNSDINPSGTEVCNNKDDDCNGRVDDIPTVTFCYDGSPSDLNPISQCHPGYEQCDKGRLYCANEQMPVAETCNGLDDDCDGQIDEDFSSNIVYDFVFVIDESGSMGITIQNVQQAVAGFSGQLPGKSYHFALVVSPGDGNDPNDLKHPYNSSAVVQDFTDAQTFSTALNKEHTGTSFIEPVYDALDDICTGAMQLSWTPGSKRFVIFFEDEEGQTDGRGLTPGQANAKAAADCMGQVTIYGFVLIPKDWTQIITATNGALYNLNMGFTQMDTTMSTLVEAQCGTAP